MHHTAKTGAFWRWLFRVLFPLPHVPTHAITLYTTPKGALQFSVGRRWRIHISTNELTSINTSKSSSIFSCVELYLLGRILEKRQLFGAFPSYFLPKYTDLFLKRISVCSIFTVKHAWFYIMWGWGIYAWASQTHTISPLLHTTSHIINNKLFV